MCNFLQPVLWFTAAAVLLHIGAISKVLFPLLRHKTVVNRVLVKKTQSNPLMISLVELYVGDIKLSNFIFYMKSLDLAKLQLIMEVVKLN